MLECIRDYIIKDVDENEKCAKCKLDELFEIDVNEEENWIIKKTHIQKNSTISTYVTIDIFQIAF